MEKYKPPRVADKLVPVIALLIGLVGCSVGSVRGDSVETGVGLTAIGAAVVAAILLASGGPDSAGKEL